REPGKFKSLPDPQVPEDILQEYFISECKTFQPDFVFIAKGDPLNALHIAIGEIRKRSGVDFANANVGHVVSFGEKVLQLQPRRANVYMVLTDCRVICIYKPRVPLQRGWKYLVTITECSKKQLGWIDPSLSFGLETVRLIQPISAERTNIGKKRTGSFFEFEFTSSSDPPPYCEKVNNLRKGDIRNIINTLKAVHLKYKLVHMDLRKYNFLRNDNGDIVIIDWGYSVMGDQTGNFAGALECMPDDVLTSLVNGEQPSYSTCQKYPPNNFQTITCMTL
ncbi:8371_t:CDS:2, partial [Ambispora leptoticha]